MGPDPASWILLSFIVKQELGHEVTEEVLAGVRGIYCKNGAP